MSTPTPVTVGTTPSASGTVALVAGPITRAERALGPDIARGAMLLLIALANVGSHRWGYVVDDRMHEVGGSAVDRVTDAVAALLVMDRSRPMFAILYGFGIAMIASRLAARGADRRDVRRVLRRRSLWLVVAGLLHGALLFAGDILAAYGATGLVALALVHRSDRALRWWFGVTLVLSELGLAVVFLGQETFMAPADRVVPGLTYTDQLVSGVFPLGLAVLSLVLFLFVPPVILGIGLHRSGWLMRPQDHLPVLRRIFWGAAAVNLVANMPYALEAGGVVSFDGVMVVVVHELHMLSGLVMGLGYVAGFGILAARWRERGRHGLPRVLAAVGERSLTAYLLQSVIMAPLLAMWGLGLGGHIGSAQGYLVAAVTWAVIAALMLALDLAGRRGPGETLLRRLTYPRTPVRTSS